MLRVDDVDQAQPKGEGDLVRCPALTSHFSLMLLVKLKLQLLTIWRLQGHDIALGDSSLSRRHASASCCSCLEVQVV